MPKLTIPGLNEDHSGTTLMEMLVVIIIISIFAAVALPSFIRARENTLDKEAGTTLKLMQTAEKIFAMQNNGSYYSSSDMALISDNLRIVLYTGGDRKWSYSCSSNGCAQATRNGYDSRTWRLRIDETNAVAGSTCP
ncbi:MAG: type II secretion system protein [Candidatus Omnitrophica bacterium]|nr:type II secretion system protein [Candidatus Omnitrophota bacterium]